MEVTLWKNAFPDLVFTGMKSRLSPMQTLNNNNNNNNNNTNICKAHIVSIRAESEEPS